MKLSSILHINIFTLILTHFLWGFVNYVYQIQIQPYFLSIYGTIPETAELLGIILSIGTLSAVIPLLFGFSADRFGRKRFILFGLILSIIGLIGLSTTEPDIIVIVGGIITFNLGIGFYDPPLQGLIHESTNAKQGTAFSLVYNSASIAGILASLLIQIQGSFAINLQFLLSCLVLIISSIINLIFLRDLKPNSKVIRFPLVKILKENHSRLIVVAFLLDALSWGLALSIANGIFIILLGVDVTFIARLIFIETVLLVIFQYPAGFAVDRYGRFFGLIVGELSGLCWIVLTLVAVLDPENQLSLDLLILAFIALGVSIAFWRPAITMSFISIDPSAASTNFGILAFISRMGWVPTAAIAGFIFSLFGYPPLLGITLIGTIIVTGVLYKIDRLETKLKTDLSQNNITHNL
ncbi:MAG: MFS transporter [Candidatus Hodarchaeota archaeon]